MGSISDGLVRSIVLFATSAAAAFPSAAWAGAASAGGVSSSQADLAVGLNASEVLLLTRTVKYDVSVTNNGPASLGSATVTVQLPVYAFASSGKACSFDSGNDTLSCPFVDLAPGATATVTAWIPYSVPHKGVTPLPATATLTASTPADPNAANDSDEANCYHIPSDGPLVPPPPQVFC